MIGPNQKKHREKILKKFTILLSTVLTFAFSASRAQLITEAGGIYIKSGTVFSTDGLSMTPSADFSFNNLGIYKQGLSLNWDQNKSINRLYRFTAPVSYKGALAINYLDEELNGNKEDALMLAYASSVGSTSYKDFTLAPGTILNSVSKTIKRDFVGAINLSDLTAMPGQSVTAPYAALKPHNMVSPNGDGVNDTWEVENIMEERFRNNEVIIFDRAGKTVYAKNGYDNTWDATMNGNALAEDTYYYVLYLDSGKTKLTGFISVVRE